MKSMYWVQQFSKKYMDVHTHSRGASDTTVFTVCKRQKSIRALAVSPVSSSAWVSAENTYYYVTDTLGGRSEHYSISIKGAYDFNYFACLQLYFVRDMKRDYYFLVKDRKIGCFK